MLPLIVLAAPGSQFEQSRPTLYALAGTYQQIPQGWVQQFAVRQQIIDPRTSDIWAEIKQRGAYHGQISDAQMATFRRNMTASDLAQKGRSDTLWEMVAASRLRKGGSPEA